VSNRQQRAQRTISRTLVHTLQYTLALYMHSQPTARAPPPRSSRYLSARRSVVLSSPYVYVYVLCSLLKEGPAQPREHSIAVSWRSSCFRCNASRNEQRGESSLPISLARRAGDHNHVIALLLGGLRAASASIDAWRKVERERIPVMYNPGCFSEGFTTYAPLNTPYSSI
jgi:hypothetical protein